MSWEEDVIREIKNSFHQLGINYVDRENLHEYMIDFCNLNMKLIKPIPRKVFIAEKVKKIYLPKQFRESLKYIKEKIVGGIDITPHMSKSVLNPSFKDGMFNEWFLHHIHLSKTQSPQDKFYQRSDFLLIAMFNDTQAFFIDIIKHSERNLFSNKEYLGIILDNWPSILERYEEKHIRPLHELNNEEINLARKNGLTYGMVTIRDKVFWNPGIGIATNGTSMLVSKQANEILRYLYATSKLVKGKIEIIRVKSFPFFQFFDCESLQILQPTTY